MVDISAFVDPTPAPSATPRRRRAKVKAPPFVILVDRREQLPFDFGPDVPTEPATLVADYSVKGLEVPGGIMLERKAIGDAVGTLSHGRRRFEAEMERLRSYSFAAVLVEGDWRAFLDYPSGMTAKSRVGSVLAMMQRYGVHWLFCPSREWAARTCELMLRRFHDDVLSGRRVLPINETESTE